MLCLAATALSPRSGYFIPTWQKQSGLRCISLHPSVLAFPWDGLRASSYNQEVPGEGRMGRELPTHTHRPQVAFSEVVSSSAVSALRCAEAVAGLGQSSEPVTRTLIG